LYFPDSTWRPKVVKVPNKKEPLVAVPGTGAPLGTAPKEAALLELIKDEIDQGRKCLLMVAQTDKLDIQPQWHDFLDANDISSAVLREDPYGREKWIATQEKKGTQVLISHPRKVETGLDILGYPTIIWMAPEFSIYTVMQASGRAYRLGQKKDCKVYHFAYTNTLQEDALKLVIAKAAAAKRVNGDTIDKDDLADLDGLARDSIVNALARVMTNQGTDIKADLIALEVEYAQVSDGIFVDRFEDCEDAEAATELYAQLVEQMKEKNDEETKVESLSDLFDKANADYQVEDAYITNGSSITDDEDPEFAEDELEDEVIEEPAEELQVKWTKARIIPTRQGVVTQVIEEPALTGVLAMVHKNTATVTVDPAVEEVPAEAEPVQQRLVFGESRIEITTRKKARKVVAAQMSLF